MKSNSRVEEPSRNTTDRRNIFDTLQENLIASIWEVVMAMVALLAIVLQEYLGTFWILILIISITAAIAGLLLRKTRWFPLAIFATGCALGCTFVWGIAFEPENKGVDSDQPSVFTDTPGAVPAGEQEKTQLVLQDTWIEEGYDLFVLDNKVYILCENVSYFPRSQAQESATFLLRLPNNQEVKAILKLGETVHFQVFNDTYYLTLLDIVRDRAKMSITYVAPELAPLTPTP